MMHGTRNDFHSFSSKYFGEGEGLQQYGDGFYFSDAKSVALQYLDDGDNGYIIHANVTLNNPIHIDGAREANLRHVTLAGMEALYNLMKMHPFIYNQPDAEATNPLGDYIPEFWNKNEWNKEELDSMIEQMVRDYYSNGSMLHLENFFDCEGGVDIFHEGVRKYFGYDGIIVDWPDGDITLASGKTFHQKKSFYAIAWFPEQITITGKDKVEHGTISPLNYPCGQSMFISKEGLNDLVKKWMRSKLGHDKSDATYSWQTNTVLLRNLTTDDKAVINSMMAAAMQGKATRTYHVREDMDSMLLPEPITEYYLPEILQMAGMKTIGEVVETHGGLLLLEGHFPVAN